MQPSVLIVLAVLGFITLSLCLGAVLYLAKLVFKIHQVGQAALSHALLEAAEMIKSQSVLEKAHADEVKANTDLRVKALTDSVAYEREKNQAGPIPQEYTLQDGRTIDLNEWSRW